MIFNPEGSEYIDVERGTIDKAATIIDRHLPGPCVLFLGAQGFSAPEDAVSNHKPIVDVIRALFLLEGPAEKPVLLPAVWEGVVKVSPGKLTYEVGATVVVGLGMKKVTLENWGERTKSMDLNSMPEEIAFSLRWYYKGVTSHRVV